MTETSTTAYDMAGIGFLADDVVFAVGAALRGQGLDADDRKAIDDAALLLTALATLDDDDSQAGSRTGELRELASNRKRVIQAARVGNAPSAEVKETLLEMSEKLRALSTAPPVEIGADAYRSVLDFFEGLGQMSLSEVRTATEGTQPAWMSLLPTGLY